MTVCYTVNNTEIIDNTEYSFDRLQAMKRAEKRDAIRKANKRKKQKIEEIKLTIVLFFMFVVLPLAMFTHWLVVGY